MHIYMCEYMFDMLMIFKGMIKVESIKEKMNLLRHKQLTYVKTTIKK